MILITHDPEDKAALAQTVVVYDAGKIRRGMVLPDQDRSQAAAGLLPSVAL